MKRTWPVLATIFAISAVALIWRTTKDSDDLTTVGHPVRFQLQWFDQAQFAGFYVASDKGFYREKGLDVEIIPGGYAVNPIQNLIDGKADIVLATADQVLISRSKGRPIRVIGTVFDGSVVCFMSRVDAQIKSPSDLIGKKVGVYRGFDSENTLLGLLKTHAISTEQVNIVDAGNPEAFVSKEIDVFPAYTFNEPLQMATRGIPVRCMTPDAFGIRAYSDTVVTTEKFLQENKEIARRFLEASSRGWDVARHDPEVAIESLFSTSRNMTRNAETFAHQRAMLTQALKHLREEGSNHTVFEMDPSRWSDMEHWLFEVGRLEKRDNIDGMIDYSISKNL